jgi:hypothetical protein
MAAPPTAMMMSVGLNFPDVLDIAQHCVNLLETQGANAREIVKNLLKLVKAVSGRDMVGVLTSLNELRGDVTELVAAIRAEFSL